MATYSGRLIPGWHDAETIALVEAGLACYYYGAAAPSDAVPLFTPAEKQWLWVMSVLAVASGLISWWLRCPMPLVMTFVLGAITSARFED